MFPLLHFECVGHLQCRGFIVLQDLTGDIDFFGYRRVNEEIIEDSLGRVYNMKFDDVVHPDSIVAIWSENDIKQNIMPALKYAGNEQFANEVLNEKNVTVIVEKMATFFAW